MDWIFHRKKGARLPSGALSLPGKTALIIGEASCGKSTLVNSLTNYFRNGNLDNLQIAAPTHCHQETEEYDAVDSIPFRLNDGESCATYSFISDDMVYNFIDTPGLNDSRGGDQDEKNLDQILTAAHDAKDLAAIIIVINGTQTRVTPALQNVLVSLRGNFPDSVTDNIIVVLTKCRADTTAFKLSDIADIAPNLKKESIFFMDNTAFASRPKDGNLVQSEILTAEWNVSMKTCAKIAKRMRGLTQVVAEDFATMRTNRFELKRILNNMKVEIVNLQGLLEQLDAAENKQKQEQNQKQMKKEEEGQEPAQPQKRMDKENFQKFLKTFIVTSTVPRATPYQNTVCSNCDYVCHQHCSMNEIKKNGPNDSIRCYAMSDGEKCHLCPGNCSYSAHYHANQVFLDVEETIEMVLQGLTRHYTRIQPYDTTVLPGIDSFSSAKAAVTLTMQRKVDDLRDICRAMKKICLSFQFHDELRRTLAQLRAEYAQLRFNTARHAAEEILHTFTCLIEEYSRIGSSPDAGPDRKKQIADGFKRPAVFVYPSSDRFHGLAFECRRGTGYGFGRVQDEDAAYESGQRDGNTPADVYISSDTYDITQDIYGLTGRRSRLPVRKSCNDVDNFKIGMGKSSGCNTSMGTGSRMVMRIGSSRVPCATTTKSMRGRAVSDVDVTKLAHFMRDMTKESVDNLDNDRDNNFYSPVDCRPDNIAADKFDDRCSNTIGDNGTNNDRSDDKFINTDAHAI